MAPQTLRGYQQKGVTEIFAAWREGARSVLAVAPTGSGKTSVFAWIAAQLDAPVTILVHRRELATQACNRLREFGVDYGLVMAGEVPRPQARVQVASVQTLVRRRIPPAKLVICDEAHLSTAATWATILEQYPNAKILGVTATPWRLSGKPLVGAYDRLVVIAQPSELREQGHLCPYVGFSYKAPDLSGVEKVGDDYNQGQAGAVMSAIVPNVVEQWKATASNLSTVVFAVTVEHSQKLAAEFVAAGVRAEHLDGSATIEQRKAILARVESGATQVLCNVGIAVEGLDIPRLKCCVLARPTMSLARAIQMMGRVRRPWKGQTARIHDHAFVIARHGLPDQVREYALSARSEDPPPLTHCEHCLAYHEPGVPCACGHVNEPKIRGEREIQEITDAEKVDFDSENEAPTPAQPPVVVQWNEIGRMIEGVFRGVSEEATQFGPRKRYAVEGKRRTYSLPGTVQLDKLMTKVSPGDGVRVTYQGEELIGSKTRKRFRVEVDSAAEHEREALIEKARKLYVEEGKSTGDVGAALGKSSATIFAWGNEGGWLRGRHDLRLPDPEIVERARIMYESGKTLTEVGQALGVSGRTIANWGEKGGWGRTLSEANRLARIPDPIRVAEARRLREGGLSFAAISVKLGAAKSTVQAWLAEPSDA